MQWGMATEERCREIFAKHGFHFSKEEVTMIHNFLSVIAMAEYKSYLKRKDDEKKGSHLYTRIDRRSS
jgi:hypothetical protein